MPSAEEQIRAVEEELQRTPYNKKTQHHIGRLKAKLARLRDLVEARRTAKGPARGYAVRKSGHATVAIAGFPSVGKSTLLNQITDARSTVAPYRFTTLEVIPGALEHRGAKIQILDLPGLIKDAAKGKGRGREVLSVIRSADLILLMLDVFETNLQVLAEELREAGLRLNERPPEVVISPKTRGGITVSATVRLTKLDEELVRAIMNEYGIINADVVIREDISEEQLIDRLAGNRTYVPALVVVNKIDLVGPEYLEILRRRLKGWRVLFISAEKGKGLAELKEALYDTLGFIRVYLKPQGKEADLVEPLVVKAGTNVGGICDTLHREFRRTFRYAQVWGRSGKFPGQVVGLDHRLADEDVLTIIVKRG